MNQAALTKLEISSDLFLLCEPELQALKIIISKIANETTPISYTKSLQGIWKDKGFECLSNLETDLTQLRAEMNTAIMNRII